MTCWFELKPTWHLLTISWQQFRPERLNCSHLFRSYLLRMDYYRRSTLLFLFYYLIRLWVCRFRRLNFWILCHWSIFLYWGMKTICLIPHVSTFLSRIANLARFHYQGRVWYHACSDAEPGSIVLKPKRGYIIMNVDLSVACGKDFFILIENWNLL